MSPEGRARGLVAALRQCGAVMLDEDERAIAAAITAAITAAVDEERAKRRLALRLASRLLARLRVAETSVGAAVDTFDDFARTLHLLGRPTLALAAEHARDGLRAMSGCRRG